MENRILIVGAGLAGLCMAFQLHKRKVPFLILHSETLPCSSEKAAGLMNPVVVKRLLKTWMADEVLPYNRRFYPEVEQVTGTSFYTTLSVHRMFPNALARGEWEARIHDGSMHDFLSSEIYDYHPEAFTGPGFGGGDVFQASSVDCEVFIPALRHFFNQQRWMKTTDLRYEDIELLEDGVQFLGERFSQVVFCEGMNGINNPWFGYLPLLPTKGELLYLEIPDMPREKEVMKGIFLAPRKQGGFVCGSTYEWQFEHENPSAEGLEKLTTELSKITHKPYTITRHTAGVRPAARDRRPFLGNHAEYSCLHVFNGLGTKGYMLAPYLSERLCDFILFGKALPAEADIKRVKKK
ncbi:MAG: FAD-binding oxidoreductase [Flavobacteriales bacterium]|nr:FAD-binding oxidoreductase [Flavobacteriales bacterium]